MSLNEITDAPWLKISQQILLQFLKRCGIDPSEDRETILYRIADAFSRIPYENLTKIIKSDIMVTPSSSMRYPDELIADYLRWGTGGTCFSLTAAIIAVYNALGIETHPVLADRHYGPDTHCGLIIVKAEGLLLLDPGYLLFTPVILPRQKSVTVQTGYNSIELVSLDNGEKVEFYTVVKGSRKIRLVYKIKPVDPMTFARAWEESFRWEMMTYPVLTRVTAGEHQYLQGKNLAIRSATGTKREILTAEMQFDYIASNMGIHRDVIKKAFGVIKHG
ncbi:MAG TPA: hypothetical protein VHP36_07500 [Chitinispirillaceae bacterium]|nr:hypothetical protein [Chitinispirillaceae bacterium]